MKKIRILQIGLGPLGIKTANFISERKRTCNCRCRRQEPGFDR